MMTEEEKDALYQKGAKAMLELSEEFSQLCFARHVAGGEEYGEFAFLSNDMIRFMAEELADLANYARYMYMKLRVWEELLDAGGADLSRFAPSKPADAGADLSSGFATSADTTGVSPILPEG